MKVDLLSTMVDLYPENDHFYPDICRQYQEEQRSRNNYIDSISLNFPDTYAARVIKTQKRPVMGCDIHEKQRIDYLKNHFWETVDLADTSLLRSNVFTNLCIEYLSLYGNSQFNQEQLEKAFIQAVDRILAASMVNEVTNNFILEYLLKGFEKFHFETVLNHIADNYLPEEKCENEGLNPELLRRLENYQKLAIGKPAPAITLNDINNKPIDLSKIHSRYILVLFWASWCPHCSVILPKLKELYDNKTYDMEIVAISVDRDEKEYKKVIENEHYTWINGSELKGWNGKTAIDYNVYATPTMFLLDTNRVITAKPITINELLEVLTQKQ
jgi:thiol-disulfide isomerase/thioredoxin